MLDAGTDFVWFLHIMSLVTLYHGCRHPAIEIWIFPGSFHDSPPSGVTAQVCHRRKRDMDTEERSLLRRHGRTISYKVRVEGCALPQRRWINCFHPMNYIQHKQHRDMMRLSLHLFLLNPVQFIRIIGAKYASQTVKFLLCNV